MKSIDLPKRLEAEKSLLTGLLHNPELMPQVMDQLKTEDFYEEIAQQIWVALVTLFNEGTNIDIISLSGKLKENNNGVAISFSTLADYTSDLFFGWKNIQNYIEQIKNASLLRELIFSARSIVEDAKQDDSNAGELLKKIEAELLTLSEQTREKRAIDSEGILKELEDDISNAEKYNWKGFDTGFQALDERTGGLIPTHIWVLGAYTGTGKTFFILQLILNILEKKAKVALFSTEMDRKITLLRMIGNLAGIGTIKMLKGNLTTQEQEQIKEAKDVLKGYKDQLNIFDAVYTVEDIRLKCKKLKIQKGLDVIFIDFIQNLRGSENIYERMSTASLELQKLAQELNITVVMVSQVNQQSAGWKSKESIDYKGAGEIAAVADVGLWITKNEQIKDVRNVHLRKVRHGAQTTFAAKIGFPSGRFMDLSDKSDTYIKTDKKDPIFDDIKEENDQIPL